MVAERDAVYRTPQETKKFKERFEGGDSPLVGKSWRSALCSPMTPVELKSSPAGEDSFHTIHKVPAGDSPYARAKHAQLIDKDPSKSVALFWAAINSNDRVDSALKDMAVVMKQLNRSEEAVEAIKSFRDMCSYEAQESLDNVLLDLYKRCGKVDEQIELLQHKLKVIEEGLVFNGGKTKITRSHGKKVYVPLSSERARLLGNIGWAYMQKNDYSKAESHYRKALSIEPDKNKQCNLAVCLMYTERFSEAKLILNSIKPSSEMVKNSAQDSYIKSFDRACEILSQLEPPSPLIPNRDREKINGASRSMTDGGRTNEKATEIETANQARHSEENDRNCFSVDSIDEKGDDRAQEEGSQSHRARIFRCDEEEKIEMKEAASPLSSALVFRSWNRYANEKASVNRWRREIDGGKPAFSDEMENISSTLGEIGFSSSAPESKTRSHYKGRASHSKISSTQNVERQIAPNSFISKYTKWREAGGTHSQVAGCSPEDFNEKTRSQASMKENRKKNSEKSPIKNRRKAVMAEDEVTLTDSIEKWKEGQVPERENLPDSKHLWDTEALSSTNSRKTWAEMVEEEEFLLTKSWNNSPAGKRHDPSQKQPDLPTPVYGKHSSSERSGEVFSDENVNSNIIHFHPSEKLQSFAENSEHKLEQVNLTPHSTCISDLEKPRSTVGTSEEVFWSPPSTFCKGSSQHKKNSDNSPFSWRFDRNPSSKRSLIFDGRQKQVPKDRLDVENHSILLGMDAKLMQRRNRLRVFQEITLPDSPRV
ncbi:uncharacterized protein [Aristolochia californica]|uniref:uncharacterized protein n=1 Tax=Aristolochia californica TaxID=171875 RepID=UPI0035DAB5C9